MNVVLGILRQVVVDNVAHVGDMQAAGRDVGANQHRKLAALESFKHFHAFLLRHVARDRERVDVVRLEKILDAFGLALGIDEHHDSRCPHFADQSHQ